MPRPPCCRRISGAPITGLFKPAGVPSSALEAIQLSLDELEALRLADLDGCYQADCATKMGVSRSTFGRIVETARRKVADALVNRKALLIDGGPVHTQGLDPSNCPRCSRLRAQQELLAGKPETPGD